MAFRLHETNRIHNFSDGVFGVAATVLIVALTETLSDRLPVLTAQGQTLLALLFEMAPDVAVWCVSVLVVGTFWIAHHNIFQLIVRADRWLLWRNTFFLGAVTFVPVPTLILASRPYDPTAVLLYGMTLIVCSLGLLSIWNSAAANRALFDSAVTPALIRRVRNQIVLGPVVYVGGMVVGQFLPWAGIAIFAVMQVVYMLPGNIDRHAPSLHTPAAERPEPTSL